MSKFFFLLSNASFLIPAFYLLFPKPNYSLNKVFIHSVLCVCTMIGSLMYHVCDEYSTECVLLLGTMYANDHLVSVMIPINILLYDLPNSFFFIRDTIIVYALISMSYLASAYQSDRAMINAFYIFGFTLSMIILFIRLSIRGKRSDVNIFMWPLRQPGRVLLWLPIEGNGYIVVSCILCWIGAFICFQYFNSDMNIYYYIHPLWHFLASMGTCLSFMFLDTLHQQQQEEEGS